VKLSFGATTSLGVSVVERFVQASRGGAMPKTSPSIGLSAAQRAVLEPLSRARARPARLVERANIVLLAADGATDGEVAASLRIDVQRARRWRHRWLERVGPIAAAESEGTTAGPEFTALVEEALADSHRSGGPPKFSAEQVAQLISLACEPPEDSDLPITHWTPAELAREAVKRRIVESISPRHLDRILKRGRPTAPQEPLLDDFQGQA